MATCNCAPPWRLLPPAPRAMRCISLPKRAPATTPAASVSTQWGNYTRSGFRECGPIQMVCHAGDVCTKLGPRLFPVSSHLKDGLAEKSINCSCGTVGAQSTWPNDKIANNRRTGPAIYHGRDGQLPHRWLWLFRCAEHNEHLRVWGRNLVLARNTGCFEISDYH